jgi:hypothetical protein
MGLSGDDSEIEVHGDGECVEQSAPTEVTEGHSVLKGVLNDLWSNLAEPCDLCRNDGSKYNTNRPETSVCGETWK